MEGLIFGILRYSPPRNPARDIFSLKRTLTGGTKISKVQFEVAALQSKIHLLFYSYYTINGTIFSLLKIQQ